jgi:hypothetical protein
MSSSQPHTAPKRSQKGSQQRLKDIEDALAGRPIVSETQPSQTQSLTGSEKRLRDIEEALSGREVPYEVTSTNSLTPQAINLKRTSCSTPEPPPRAKRRQLSPDSPYSSPLPSLTNSTISLPGSPITDATTPFQSEHSSPSPTPDEVRIFHLLDAFWYP